MPTVADCLRQHAPAYTKEFGDSMPLIHQKVLSAITRCRTGLLGGVHYRCDDCGRDHWVGRSCGNRHCPNCGKEKSARWLEKMSPRLLPVHHFLVTFTVPLQVGSVLRSQQKVGYRALFDAGAASIRDCASATKSLRGAQLGFFGVLHTWGRDPMIYHPHVHFVVPGGGVSEDGTQWNATPENFFLHHATLLRVYKAKLADHLRSTGLYESVPAEAWQKKFVVDIKPVGDGRAVLKYLAPYVNRVAISDSRIVGCDESSVTYRYTPSGTNHSKTRTVPGNEFVRGFLQHSLPKGLQKIRYYGWMSPNSRVHLDAVKWLVWLFLGWTFWLGSGHAPQEQPDPPSILRCGQCGGSMRVVEVTFMPRLSLSDPALAYFDSS